MKVAATGSGELSRSCARRRDRLDLHFPWQCSGGNGSTDFQHPIAILSRHSFLVHAFRQYQTAREGAVADLLLEVIAVPGFALVATLAGDGQRVALHVNLDIFGIHARQLHLAMEFLAVFVDVRFDGGSKLTQLCQVLLRRWPPQEPVEYLIEIPAEIDHVLKESVTRN